uniref:Secreted protein n=1 Tax=Zea mays TaxID=4577 RepID=B6SZF7_MAIZE|nr:hypothetical protein [Zea mays]
MLILFLRWMAPIYSVLGLLSHRTNSFSYGDRFVLVLTATHLPKAFNCLRLLQKLHVMKVGATQQSFHRLN